MAKYILTGDGEIHVSTDHIGSLDVDELFEEAARLVISEGKGSVFSLQRKLEIGYSRAARILDQLEEAGILASSEGNEPSRTLFDSYEKFLTSIGNVPLRQPCEVHPEQIEREWEHVEVKNNPFSVFQKKYVDSSDIRIPLGVDKRGKIVDLSVDDIGHLYIFSSPLCSSTKLVSNMIEVLVNTYSPRYLNLIVSDDVRTSAYKYLAAKHLLTPVINDYSKINNALSWAVAEISRRQRLFQECGVGGFDEYNEYNRDLPLSRIVCFLNEISGRLALDRDILSITNELISIGHLAGIHLVIVSPLMDKKYARSLTSFPTKIVFKTFSVDQANTLGTDDAFELQSPSKFIFIPAYGKVEKLTIGD